MYLLMSAARISSPIERGEDSLVGFIATWLETLRDLPYFSSETAATAGGVWGKSTLRRNLSP